MYSNPLLKDTSLDCMIAITQPLNSYINILFHLKYINLPILGDPGADSGGKGKSKRAEK